MNEQNRREFEATVGPLLSEREGHSVGYVLQRNDGGADYFFSVTAGAWIAWQAARASVAERVSVPYTLPERWVAVPVEATEKMRQAFCVKDWLLLNDFDKRYPAMLAAAPKVQGDADGGRTPTSNPALATALYERIGDFRVYRDRDVVEVWDCGIGAWRRWGTVPEFEFNAPQTTGRGAPPEQPATVKECLTVGDEPYAWAYTNLHNETNVVIGPRFTVPEGFVVRALYLAPPATTEEPSAVGKPVAAQFPREFDGAFVTSINYGRAKRYELVFKFPNIHAMQAAHNAWVRRDTTHPDARDAARYRWLRIDRDVDPETIPSIPWPMRVELKHGVPAHEPVYGTDLDTAIDRAMGAKDGKS